ncbi:sodium:solute symporter family protein [Alteribacillus bidgolensis]|uniref:Sodium/pantothenate symporter n=1 Tax=Alteribacillus bidgolensis TaxID=930129 RepID=A0A1G8IEI2_9BACI|nr:sodium:solute symporter family protein [Alteribacillus bidgolensis]SDI16960.1 sodium/pantothenate symporter [Alteribacillus bidgolensis]
MNTILIVVIVYLLAMVVIGFLYSKKASQDGESFLVANRNMGSFLGGGSLASTYASTSSFLGTLGAMYAFGVAFGLWQNAGVLIGFTLATIFIAPKFRAYGSLSFSQFFELRYNKKVRFVSAIVTIVAMFVYIMAQLQGGAYAIQYVLGINYWVGVLLIGAVFILYVVLGGSHSSIIASFTQFVMMMIAMLTVTAVTIIVEPWGNTTSLALENDPVMLNLWGNEGPFYSISIFFMMILGAMSAPQVYLMYMFSKSNKVAQKNSALATTYLSIFYFILLLVGVFIIGNFPNLENPDMGYFHTLDMLPTVVAGVFVAAVLAAAMSSTDAMLLNATSAITNDLYSIISGKTLSNNVVVFVNRIVASIIGIIAILVTLNPPNLILLVMALAQSLMIGAFLIPLVLGLWWKKATAKAALAGMIGGFSVAVIAQFIPLPTPFIGGPLGALTSLILMVIVSHKERKSVYQDADIAQ